MLLESRLFTRLSGMTLVASWMVIQRPHPVHAVIALILAFVSASGLMMLLQLEFMALRFMVVYVGAIAVLFLFVVMMLNLSPSEKRPHWVEWGRALRLASMIYHVLITSSRTGLISRDENSLGVSSLTYVTWIELLDSMSSRDPLGHVLYTHRWRDLILAGYVLLVALVGAIVLTLKVRHAARSKRQHVHQQMSRDADHAVRMVLDDNDGHTTNQHHPTSIIKTESYERSNRNHKQKR
jgi:NADH-quinone oxidoreductase subunit J